MVDSGLISKWSQDAIDEIAAQSVKKKSTEAAGAEGGESIDRIRGPQALKIESLQGAFIVMIIGNILAFFVLLAEWTRYILFKY